jgi:cell division control protein 42
MLRTSTCYKNTDVFLVCFSVVSPHSFQNVKQKWVPELQEHSPNTPFILVGTQTDMRSDQATLDELRASNLEPITPKVGQRRAKEIKALAYVECSAKELDSVVNVFRSAITFLLDADAKARVKVQKQFKKELALEKKYEKKMAKRQKPAENGDAEPQQ